MTAPMGDDLRDRLTEALTREHYRRASERIATSPEEHSAAMAEVAMGVLAAKDVGELRAQLAQTAVVRPGDMLVVRVDPRAFTRARADQMIEGMEERLPDVKVVVIGAEEMVVYRSEAPRFEVTAGSDVTNEQAARFAEEFNRRQAMLPRRTT